MIQAVIFDMDGVLIDSVPAGNRARRRVLDAYGIDLDTIPDPMNEGHRGASAKNLLAAVKRHTGAEIKLEEYAQKGLRFIEQDLRAHNVVADPALVSFLQELKRYNVPMAIASSGLRPTVLSKLSVLGIQNFFTAIVTGSEIAKHKPEPDTYIEAARHLGVNPAHCIAFEDSVAGAISAKAAGCKVIGFTRYNNNTNALPGAICNIQDWSEITHQKLQKM